MTEIGIGIIGGGYMGKAHAVAMSAVGAVFNTALRPRLEMICASTAASAERYRTAYGFARATDDWRVLVNDPKVAAIIIAAPQETHREIALAAFALSKPVFCEKPLGASLAESREMVAAAVGQISMVGFNYIRTPAWRTTGDANGTMGDLAPHMINGALALIGPIASVMADVETVHATRPGGAVTNDDHGQMMCRFANGAMGQMYFSRIAQGRKMGYAYEITGTRGAIRFDQEDQNAI